jgi:hypothetical protein
MVSLLAVLAVAVVAFAPASAVACDKDKAKTSASSASVQKKGATAVVASAHGSCAAKGTSAAVAAGSSCSAKGTSAAVASNGASCGTKSARNAKTAVMASAGTVEAMPAGASCHGEGAAGATAKSAHGDCTACVDMANCEGELASVGAHMQVVPLKNGVMYVYTAEGASKVHAVQASLARRTERLVTLVSSGDKASLCGECKVMRGAMASGKLNREVVNIEGGCLTLMTSNDPAVVSKIHAMAGVGNASRKS